MVQNLSIKVNLDFSLIYESVTKNRMIWMGIVFGLRIYEWAWFSCWGNIWIGGGGTPMAPLNPILPLNTLHDTMSGHIKYYILIIIGFITDLQ